MDPKQNNDSFGSLSSGGDGPMAGGAGAAGGAPEVGAVPVASTPEASAPVASNPVANNPATSTPAAAGGNTIFPGAVGATGVSGFGGTTSIGGVGAGFGSAPGTNPVASNPFGQAGASQGQANAFFAQGNMNTGMPISSGTGDVVVGGGQKQNQKKMLLVGGLIALVLLIVVCLIVGVISSRGGGFGGGGQGDVANQKSAFNSYANYVLFGEDSDEDLTEEEMNEYSVYFESLGDNEDEIIKYTLEANKKFDALKGKYSSDDWYEQLALSNIRDYFQIYPTSRPLTVKEVSDLYSNGGSEAVEALIDSRYSAGDYFSDNEEMSGDLLSYFKAASDIGLFQLEIVEKARALDCVLTDFIENSCYTMSEEEIQRAGDYYTELYDAEGVLRRDCFSGLWGLYNELYGLVNEEEDVVTTDEGTEDSGTGNEEGVETEGDIQ